MEILLNNDKNRSVFGKVLRVLRQKHDTVCALTDGASKSLDAASGIVRSVQCSRNERVLGPRGRGGRWRRCNFDPSRLPASNVMQRIYLRRPDI